MNGLEKKNGKMLNGKVMDIEKVNESSFWNQVVLRRIYEQVESELG